MTSVRLRLTNVLLTLVLFALLAVIAMLASDARGGPLDPPGTPSSTDGVRQPGTPISGQALIVLPGHYYLTRDIFVGGFQIAITIAASDVSLDLGGFTVRGDDGGGNFGILVSGAQTDVSISNGTVRDFQIGVETGDGSRIHIDRVNAVSNVRGFHLGAASVLSECSALQNTETGIVVLGNLTRVSQCTSVDNAHDGIYVEGASNFVERSYARGNDLDDIHDGALSDSNTFRDNVVSEIVLTVDGFASVIANVCAAGNIVNPTGNFLSGNLFCD